MAALLIIFAKEPVSGQVKTRLCPPLAPEAAARLYQGFLEDTLEEMARLPDVHLALAYDPGRAHVFFQSKVPAGVRLFPQEGPDLGDRLVRAFQWGFTAGFHPVLIRNSDSPDLPGDLVLEAGEVLASGRAEMALGPCPDGGYYLVGLTAPQPAIFQGVAWSTGAVFAATLDRARRLSLTVHVLPPWPDIDTYADLLAFLQRPHPPSQPGRRSDLLARELLAATMDRAPESHSGQ